MFGRVSTIGLVAASLAVTVAEARGPATHIVVVDKMTFGALPGGLHVGDTIVWVNRDIFQHSATATDRSFDVDLPPGKSARLMLKRAGAVRFSCKYHPGMKGTLSVAR
jgi:plastocyanin